MLVINFLWALKTERQGEPEGGLEEGNAVNQGTDRVDLNWDRNVESEDGETQKHVRWRFNRAH